MSKADPNRLDTNHLHDIIKEINANAVLDSPQRVLLRYVTEFLQDTHFATLSKIQTEVTHAQINALAIR